MHHHLIGGLLQELAKTNLFTHTRKTDSGSMSVVLGFSLILVPLSVWYKARCKA